MTEAHEKVPMRLTGFCLMKYPDHLSGEVGMANVDLFQIGSKTNLLVGKKSFAFDRQLRIRSASRDLECALFTGQQLFQSRPRMFQLGSFSFLCLA